MKGVAAGELCVFSLYMLLNVTCSLKDEKRRKVYQKVLSFAKSLDYWLLGF